MDVRGDFPYQSGYELLDMLSRRRQYAKSHVRQKVPLLTWDALQCYHGDTGESIGVHGNGFNWFPVSLGSRDRQILLRLMERTSLDPRRPRPAQWFDECKPLHQHNAEYLQRLAKLRDELINQEETNLANALERLRQRHNNNNNGLHRGYRPRDTQNILLEPANRKGFVTTLEQFKRSRPPKSPPRILPLEGRQLMEPNGRSSYGGEKDTYSVGSARSADESFRLNLQRLIQPTSSIPNIGRKSTRPNKQLVLESSPLQRKDLSHNKHAFINTSSGAHAQDRSGPPKPTFKGSRVRDLSRSEDLELSPHAIHYGSLGDQDQMNVDRLKDYCCDYYLPPNTPVREMDSSWDSCSNSVTSSRRSDCDVTNRPILAPIEGRGITKQTKSKRPFPKGRVIGSDGKTKFRIGSYDTLVQEDYSNFEGKRRIVVDMPCIVFNSASPDICRTEDVFERENTILLKTYKQNELRQREVKNLMEDVKELNMRNEHLTDTSGNT